MADLDDGPDQAPLLIKQVQATTLSLLAGLSYDLLLTHGPHGEYTHHRRHEECCQSVEELWQAGGINIKRLWLFAYEDGGRAYLPRVCDDADRRDMLAENIWIEKRRVHHEKKVSGVLTRLKQRLSAQQFGRNNRESTRTDRISGAGGRLGAAGRTIVQGPQ
jgi:hypothetical protein